MNIFNTRNQEGRKVHSSGFTLVEMIIVIAILAILATIAIPSFIRYIETAKKEVCNTNRIQLERMYHSYTALEEIDPTEAIFENYMQEYDTNICPDDSVIEYREGKVQCNVHSTEDDDSEDDGSVPFL